MICLILEIGTCQHAVGTTLHSPEVMKWILFVIF